MNRFVALSPSKVLLYGGYTILEKNTEGISVSVSACIACGTEPGSSTGRPIDRQQKDSVAGTGTICTKQLGDSYSVSVQASGSTVRVAVSPNPRELPSLVLAPIILVAICRPTALLGTVWVAGERPFYGVSKEDGASQPFPRTLARTDQGTVAKTGLGSSAALVVSLLSALLPTYSLPHLESLALLAHAAGQGKLGSGFDVVSAFRGPIFFRVGGRGDAERRAVDILVAQCDRVRTGGLVTLDKALVDLVRYGGATGEAGLAPSLVSLRPPADLRPVPWPTGLSLLLGDVQQGGSSTVSLVRSVQAWRAADASSATLWQELIEANRLAGARLVALHAAVAAAGRSPLGRRLDVEVGKRGPHTRAELEAAASRKARPAPVAAAVLAMREAGEAARRVFRSLGVAAKVPIEPPGTTALLDELVDLPGVVAVGVPGAGGYDAVFVLATHDECTASVDAVFARHATARLDVSIRTHGMVRGPEYYNEETMGYFTTPHPAPSPSSDHKRARPSVAGEERTAAEEQERRLWLVKSEPNEYGWDHLVAAGTDVWDGVRNHRAAKNLRTMKVGDLAFFYHSCVGREIVGIVEVVEDGLLDPTDETNKWAAVRVKPVRRLERPISLAEIKADAALADMELIRLSRLSVATVTPAQWRHIVQLAADTSSTSSSSVGVKKKKKK